MIMSNNVIKILIVDDEEAAGNILRLLIEKHIPGEKTIKYCNTPEAALALLPEFKPSLVMLDIEMPNMNGFDFLNKAVGCEFDVIFTTAYDKYAIKAIRFSALDYLLKPVDMVELQNAINRHIVKKELHPQLQKKLVGNLISNLQQKDASTFKLALSTMEGVFFFEPAGIVRCEGENNYTRFYFPDRKPLLVSKTMKEYEDILTEYDFIRVHKSHLVNRNFVKHMDKDDLLWLTDGSHIVVSRRKKEEVMRILMNKK